MRVTEDGLLVAEADDPKVVHMLRRNDYGPQVLGGPVVGVNHVYGIPVAYGETSPERDGTESCASRVASGRAQYYAHVYMSLDGSLYQVCRLTRAAIHCAGSISYTDGKSYPINKVSIGLEWAGSGWFYQDGTDWTGPKGRKMWNGKVYDVNRPDFQLVGNYYWQEPTQAQVEAATKFWKACLDRFSTLTPESVIRGHGEVGKGTHSMCPGPLILRKLQREVYVSLKGGTEAADSYVHPYSSFRMPDACVDPFEFFLAHPYGVSDEELYAELPQTVIELLIREGYISHEDPEQQMSDTLWHWVGAKHD